MKTTAFLLTMLVPAVVSLLDRYPRRLPVGIGMLFGFRVTKLARAGPGQRRLF